MRVLFVLNSLGAGGTEHSTAVLLPFLRNLGVECRVVTLAEAEEGDEDGVRAQGFDVTVLRAGGFASRVRELRRMIADYRPDVVHTALFDADQIGRVAAARMPVSVVSSLVSTPYDPARFADPEIRPWKLRTVQMIDALTGRLLVDRFHAVSDGVATANTRALRLRPSRVTVVERGRSREDLGSPSSERRRRARDNLEIASDAPVVLSVGRHDFAKSHEVFVRACRRLAEDKRDVVALIAGRTGRSTGSLRDLIHELALDSTVRLLGHRTDVADLMVAADVLAISSRFEGTAGVALEAMALDLPIVSTRVAGLRGILANGENALLVDVDDAAEMASAIRRLLDDPELADSLRRRARDDFETRFTLTKSAANMLALYEAERRRRDPQ